MKNVGLLGGAFNPITLSHIKVAEFVLENTKLDEIWLLPALKHKFNKEMVSFNHRINMCRIATKNYHHIKVSSFELLNTNGSVYELLCKLKQIHRYCNFNFIIGSDNVLTFHKWYKYEWLKKMYHL